MVVQAGIHWSACLPRKEHIQEYLNRYIPAMCFFNQAGFGCWQRCKTDPG
jgi:hypothetical protein